MFTLEEFKSQGLFPSDTALVDESELNVLTESTYADNRELYNSDVVLVVDNPEWIAHSESTGMYVSANQSVIGKYKLNNKSFLVQRLKMVGDIPKLKTKNSYTLKGEINKMKEENLNLDAVDFSDINLDEISDVLDQPGVNPTDVEKLNQFNGAAVVEDKPAKAEKTSELSEKEVFINAVTSELNSEAITDVELLADFNQEYGSLYGYIVDKDAFIKPVLSSEYVMNNGKPSWKPGVADSVIEQYEKGHKDVLKGNCEIKTKLQFKHSAPGKILSAVIGMPQGGIKPLSDLQNEETCKPDRSKKNVIISCYDLDAAIRIVANHFNNKIYENPVTFGEYASYVTVQMKTSTRRNKDSGEVTSTSKFVLKANKRTNLICPDAYFPIVTYDTIPVEGKLTDEQTDLLSLSSLYQFYHPAQSKADPTRHLVGSRKIDFLEMKDDVIVKEEDGKFYTSYFAQDPNARTNLEIKPYYDKNSKLSVIEIPVKVAKENDKGQIRYSYNTFSAIGKQDSEAAMSKNSLALAQAGTKFQVFYNAVGADILNTKTLEEAKPSRGSSRKNNDFTSDTIRKLLAKQQSGVKMSSVSFDTKNMKSSKGLNAKLARLADSAEA